jgi:hypothetical protein
MSTDQAPEQVIADALITFDHGWDLEAMRRGSLPRGWPSRTAVATVIVDALRSAGYLLDPGKVAVDREDLEALLVLNDKDRGYEAFLRLRAALSKGQQP